MAGLNWQRVRSQDRLRAQARESRAATSHRRAVEHVQAKTKLVRQLRSEGRACLKCPGALVRQTRKSDHHPFLGCTNFPRCTHTQDLRSESRRGTATTRGQRASHPSTPVADTAKPTGIGTSPDREQKLPNG